MTFDERIRKAINETKTECHYNPKAYIQMVDDYGALNATKRLLSSKQKITEGLIKLYELGRLDLCFESIIFEPEWHDLFTKEELTEAKNRLKSLNYDVSNLNVEPLKPESDNKDFIFNLSFQQFIEVLKTEDILHSSDIPLLKCFVEETDKKQSAPQLASKLGYSDIGPVNALVGKFAKRIADYFEVSLERDGNSPGWWRIIADGQETDNTFYWTLKPNLIKALNELHLLDTKPNYWLLPSNEKIYDIEQAYLEYHTIDWHQERLDVQINDIVYIYKSLPQQFVRFKCVVTAVNKSSSNNKDVDCYRDSKFFENKKRYMTLKFLYRIEDVFPTMEGLKENGIKLVRGMMPISDKVLKYIEECEKTDRNAKRFDGEIPADIPHNHWSIVGFDEDELREKTEKEAKGLSDTELFEKAKQQGELKPKGHITTTSAFVRNAYVAEASKRRANGICQLCGQPAPFKDKNGKPYLESHHIIWLSEGGSDTLDNTAALCPNCHKKMHVVNDPKDVIKLQEVNK